MQILVADYETYFGDDYTLSKMTTESYIRDRRFEAHGCAFFTPGYQPRWVAGRDLPAFLQQIDWSDTALMCWHAQFDGLIFSHHYGIKPKFWFCPMSMSRMMLGNHISVSLDSVRKHFNLPPKTTPYNLFRGRRWHELSPAVQQQMGEGACDEVRSIWHIFQTLMQQGFPEEELSVIDLTIRMFTEPVLRADVDLLAQLWESEDKRKKTALVDLGVAESDLQSAQKFQELLEAEGVEIEYKEGKNGPIPAFAKNDEFIQGLLDDADDKVRALAEARLGVKSTLLQTRAATLGFMASRGSLPVYLRYCGAGTLRFSGGDGANWQNFKRQDPDNPKEASPLRRSIMAPEGYLLAPVDLSQIEARVCAYLAGQEDLLEKFRTKQDPYIGMASAAYGYEVTPDMKVQRGTGKQLILSCQYMAAEVSIQKTARLGIYGPPVHIDLATALRWKNSYRSTNAEIVQYWKTASRMLSRIAGGPPLDWGPAHIKDKRIYLPNGTVLVYDTLAFHKPAGEELEKCKPFERDGYWRVQTRQGWKTMHGGKITQHLCEAVSRVIVTQAALRISAAGFRILNIPHDELLVLVKQDGREQEALEFCLNEMRRTPEWLPGISLAAEGSLGIRYEK